MGAVAAEAGGGSRKGASWAATIDSGAVTREPVVVMRTRRLSMMRWG